MEGSPQGNGNHLTAVGDLLFDGAETQAQHLAVIHKGISQWFPAEERAVVLDYASEHLEGGALIDVQLTVAEKIVEQIDGRRETPDYRSHGDHRREENSLLVSESLSLLATVVDSPLTLEESTYRRAFDVLAEIRSFMPGVDYNAMSVNEAGNPFAGDSSFVHEDRFSAASTELLAASLVKKDSNDASIRGPEHEAEALKEMEDTFAYGRGISALTADFLERAVVELDDPAESLRKPVHAIYVEQAKWANTKLHYNPLDYGPQLASSQLLVDRLLDAAVTHIDANTPSAVQECLDIHNDDALDYSGSSQLPAKALEMTRASSREPETEVVKSRLGFKRTEQRPSLFEARRALLEEQVTRKLYGYLKHQPDFVTAVIGLYDGDSETGQVTAADLWGKYASQVANRSFTNGHYKTDAIQRVRVDLALFGQVAPEGVVEEAETLVKTRLATSTAR